MLLDSSDIVFLNALASQMAIAIDRANLATRERLQKDQESRQLREEVRGLRQALHQSKVVYQSEAMASVMDTLRRVAPSDATVLIIGESGTGKEMLAQSLHDFSDRREKPFVVFDCGAIAHSLLESELFGHTKGAFTGAQNASSGRIAQAEGGTLFLDEIGELPLETQSKLLRFVQEKTYSPVGNAQTRHADVRIVAATNRRLQDEVAAGRFRSDLYYRLRVISVQAIPLRERPDDILPLARTFLERFATQYGNRTLMLSADAERELLEHAWPGNVRELQNCIMRAVLIADADVLDADALEFVPDTEGGLHATVTPLPDQPTLHGRNIPERVEPAQGDPWLRLEQELHRQVQFAVARDSRRPEPLGRWLGDDIVLEAYAQCDRVARRGAHVVGVAESTFRRHLDKANTAVHSGFAHRSEDWQPVRILVQSLIQRARKSDAPGGNLLERARDALLECVRQEVAARPSVGASLMGVSPPTYKRWLQRPEQAGIA